MSLGLLQTSYLSTSLCTSAIASSCHLEALLTAMRHGTQGYLSGAAACNQGVPCTPIPPRTKGGSGTTAKRTEVTRSGCFPRAIPVCALSHVRSDRANKHQPIALPLPCYLPADNMTWDGLHHWFVRPGEATAEDLLRGRRTVAAALVTARSSGVVASHTPRPRPTGNSLPNAVPSPATALPSVSGCPMSHSPARERPFGTI